MPVRTRTVCSGRGEGANMQVSQKLVKGSDYLEGFWDTSKRCCLRVKEQVQVPLAHCPLRSVWRTGRPRRCCGLGSRPLS